MRGCTMKQVCDRASDLGALLHVMGGQLLHRVHSKKPFFPGVHVPAAAGDAAACVLAALACPKLAAKACIASSAAVTLALEIIEGGGS